jgi:hypothetical protein
MQVINLVAEAKESTVSVRIKLSSPSPNVRQPNAFE